MVARRLSDVPPLSRRSALLGLLAAPVLSSCGGSARPAAEGASAVPLERRGFEAAIGDLERRYGADIGVLAHDTGSGAVLEHRADQRFMMCSVFKGIAAAAVLRRSQDDPGLLGREVAIPPASELLEYAPYTSIQAGRSASYEQLCQAAVSLSDNVAGNLLLDLLGGPRAVTDFARSVGDDTTRLDRREPDLDVGKGEELRDSTTPRAIAGTYQKIVLGDVLSAERRQKLTGWLLAGAVSGGRIRSGVPPSWKVADKSGTGRQGDRNDVAVMWPGGGRGPVVLAILARVHDPAGAKEQMLAETAAAATAALGL